MERSKATIWAVDDEKDLLHSFRIFLSDAGFTFRGFEDPRELKKALEQELPDLLVVDLNLPHLTGAELMRQLRASPRTRRLPIVVVTALVSESSILNAFEAGADDVVRKPFGISELLARISWQLKRSLNLQGLHQENEDLAVMTELAQTMSETRSLPSAFRDMIDSIKTSLDVVRVSVYLVDQASGDLHRVLPSDPSRAEGSPNMSLDLRGLPKVVESVAGRRPLLLDSDGTDELLKAMGGVYPTRAPNHSAAVFPLRTHAEFVGVMVLVSATPQIGAAQREFAIASIAADLAAMAVKRSHLEMPAVTPTPAPVLSPKPDDLGYTLGFLEGVIDSSPNAIVAADIHGVIVLFNCAAERVLGWSQEEAIGQSVRILYPSGGAERIMHMMRSEGFGGRGALTHKREILHDRHGVEIPVEISASMVRDEGKDVGSVGIFTDLRGRIEMEAQLLEATESLETNRRQAVAAELAGAAAHELNQPLTSLLGYAELMRKRVGEDSELHKPVDKIYSEAQRVADIVRKIGRITDYRTKEYVGGTRIVDLDKSSEAEELHHFSTRETTALSSSLNPFKTQEISRHDLGDLTSEDD